MKKRGRHRNKEKGLGSSYYILLAIIVIGILVYVKPAITGYSVLDSQLVFNENATYELPNITSLKLSGSIEGLGDVSFQNKHKNKRNGFSELGNEPVKIISRPMVIRDSLVYKYFDEMVGGTWLTKKQVVSRPSGFKSYKSNLTIPDQAHTLSKQTAL